MKNGLRWNCQASAKLSPFRDYLGFQTREWHPQALPVYSRTKDAKYYPSSACIDHLLVHDNNLDSYPRKPSSSVVVELLRGVASDCDAGTTEAMRAGRPYTSLTPGLLPRLRTFALCKRRRRGTGSGQADVVATPQIQRSIADAVTDLGAPEDIGKVFAGFQKYLYEKAA